MNIDLSSVDISLVAVEDLDEMVLHRINYLQELYGQVDDGLKKRYYTELVNYFSVGIKNGSVYALKAKHNGSAVSYGVIVLRVVPGDFEKSVKLEGDILNMYTVPEARSNGISKKILTELIHMARTKGVSKLSLHTTVLGEKLYKSVGFSDATYPFLELNL